MKIKVNSLTAVGLVLGAAMLVTPAMAKGPKGPHNPHVPNVPPVEEPDCAECVGDTIDINQLINGVQEALNRIEDVNEAADVTQTALNAANLINLKEIDPLGALNQAGNNLTQTAANRLEGNVGSEIENVTQSATNLLNSITASTVRLIDQSASGTQSATNYMSFGDYTGPEDFDAEEAATQAAFNGSNIVNLSVALTGTIDQTSNVTQDAINTAAVSVGHSGGGYHTYGGPGGGGGGGYGGSAVGDVTDFAQQATNVTNSVVAQSLTALECGCVSIEQTASADQYALNALAALNSGSLNLTGITQAATNIANSISMPTVEVPE